MKNNEKKKAEEIWANIENKESLYAKMIKEKKNQLNWESSYSKYLNRIPAMSK